MQNSKKYDDKEKQQQHNKHKIADSKKFQSHFFNF